MNPLLTPFDTAPFSQLKNEHFKPAFIQSIDNARAEIDAITANKAEPSFQNTIEALEFTGQQLDRISSVFFNLNSADTNEEIQKIAQEVSPLLSEFGNDVTLNEELFARIKTVYGQRDKLTLSTEQVTLLDKDIKALVETGPIYPKKKRNGYGKLMQLRQN